VGSDHKVVDYRGKCRLAADNSHRGLRVPRRAISPFGQGNPPLCRRINLPDRCNLPLRRLVNPRDRRNLRRSPPQ